MNSGNDGVCKPWWLAANVTIMLAGLFITMQSWVSVQSSLPVRPQSSLSARSLSSSTLHIIWKKILWMWVSTLGAKPNTLDAYLSFFISQCQCSSVCTGWWFAQRAWCQQTKAVSPTVAQVRSCTHDALQWWHFSGIVCIRLILLWICYIPLCTSFCERILVTYCTFPTWQVNFYHDHTKIILCSQNEEYLLTYINEERVSTTLRLSTLLCCGCSSDLRSRMEYALNMLLQRCNWSIMKLQAEEVVHGLAFFWIDFMDLHWLELLFCWPWAKCPSYMIVAMDLRYKHWSCPQELLNSDLEKWQRAGLEPEKDNM